VTAFRSSALLIALVAAAATTPASAQERRVIFDRFEYRLTGVGQTVTAKVGVLDALLRPMPSAPIAWRTDNPATATVSSRGVVQAKSVGITRLWAISGRDSAFATIAVVRPVNTIEFDPGLLRLESTGARLALKILVRDASGLAGADLSRTSACRSRNGRVATLSANGQVLARATGITYIYCSSGGVADSARVEVGQRPVTALIADGYSRRMSVGDTTSVRVWATNSSGEHIADASPSWTSRNPATVTVDAAGLVRAVGPGEATIVAHFSGISDSVRIAVQGQQPPQVAIAAPRPDSLQVVPREPRAPVVTQATTDTAGPAERRARAAFDSALAASQSRSTPRIGGKPVSLGATAQRTGHSSRLAQGVKESRGGLLVGLSGSIALKRTFTFATGFRAGTLTGDGNIGDVKVAEVDGQLTYWPREWFGLRGGLTRRSESTDISLHHWQFASTGAATRVGFMGGKISASSALSLVPWGSFSGHAVSPKKTSFAMESGLELQTSFVSVGLTHYLEQFSFPAVSGTARQDRFSSLRLRIGVQAGR